MYRRKERFGIQAKRYNSCKAIIHPGKDRDKLSKRSNDLTVSVSLKISSASLPMQISS